MSLYFKKNDMFQTRFHLLISHWANLLQPKNIDCELALKKKIKNLLQPVNIDYKFAFVSENKDQYWHFLLKFWIRLCFAFLCCVDRIVYERTLQELGSRFSQMLCGHIFHWSNSLWEDPAVHRGWRSRGRCHQLWKSSRPNWASYQIALILKIKLLKFKFSEITITGAINY